MLRFLALAWPLRYVTASQRYIVWKPGLGRICCAVSDKYTMSEMDDNSERQVLPMDLGQHAARQRLNRVQLLLLPPCMLVKLQEHTAREVRQASLDRWKP